MNNTTSARTTWGVFVSSPLPYSSRFAGAGTALKMALLNHRRYLGFEINPQYVEIARRRLTEAETTMAARMRKAN